MWLEEERTVSDTQTNMPDYEDARRAFQLEVPAAFNYGRDVVDHQARVRPDALALLALDPQGEEAQRLSFRDLSERSNRAANFLAAQGVATGDRIFLMMPRIPQWYDVMLGAFKIGAVPMPGTVQLTPKDIRYRIDIAEATVAVTDPEGAAKVDEVASTLPTIRQRIVAGGAYGEWVSLEEGMERASASAPETVPTAASDPLLIYFTSGTTGQPKMVLHTHASYGIGHEITARFWMDLRPGDLHWTISDFGWAKAAYGKLFGQWRLGAAVLVWDGRGKPEFDQMLHIAEQHGVTTFCAPPTIYRQFVQMDLSRYDLSRMRHAMAAGEPLESETFEVWKQATGLEIHDGYGQTETCITVANYPSLRKKPGSMGKPSPGYDVAVVDDDGVPVESGVEGQIAIKVKPERPVGLFSEYWKDPKRTSEVFRGDWYLSGDRARVDEDGYFWFGSRADDVIISAGYRIGPFEVESVVIEHPSVAETAVIGVPDRERGQVVKAFVVLAKGQTASPDLAGEIQQFCKESTAPYKYPRHIEFVNELPKTISGKIRRVELREREAATG